MLKKLATYRDKNDHYDISDKLAHIHSKYCLNKEDDSSR